MRRAAEAEDPVANAIEFARYVDGTFGWNINDPGHGFVIANARPTSGRRRSPAALRQRHLGAAADHRRRRRRCPPALESYLLDLKPGYDDDPTRAVYNHVWLIGDEAALSVDLQVEVDEIAEVAPVTSGSGPETLGPGARNAGARGASSDGDGNRRKQDGDSNERERATRPAQRPRDHASTTSARWPARRPPTSRCRSATGSSG